MTTTTGMSLIFDYNWLHSTCTYFDPRHIVLLHFLHFLFDAVVQFVFEFQRLHVIHVTVVVMKVSESEQQRISMEFPYFHLEFILVPFFTHLASEDRNFSWASRAAFASSSSYRLQLYHDDPCGSHDPKHTQQKSCLQFWFLQTWFALQ